LLITGSDEVGLQHKIKNVMRELEIWFEKNNLITNFEKTFAVLFHPKQKRV
jgi:DNA gyrase inhibitor GyrI